MSEISKYPGIQLLMETTIYYVSRSETYTRLEPQHTPTRQDNSAISAQLPITLITTEKQ